MAVQKPVERMARTVHTFVPLLFGGQERAFRQERNPLVQDRVVYSIAQAVGPVDLLQDRNEPAALCAPRQVRRPDHVRLAWPILAVTERRVGATLDLEDDRALQRTARKFLDGHGLGRPNVLDQVAHDHLGVPIHEPFN